MNKYSLESTDSLIIVKSGERETTLSLYDLYTYDYTTYEQIDVTEESITNAIIEVTIEEKPKVYFLEGHNYYQDEYFQLVKQDIRAEANDVENLNILTQGSVPQDCDCLVITTLKSDLTQMEKEQILVYINNGGKILLLSDSNILGIETPNFDEILNLYGISISKGIIMEQDTNQMIYNAPQLVIARIQSVINENVNMDMCVMNSGRIEFKDKETLSNLGVTYRIIAQTSDKAFLRTNLTSQSASKTNEDKDAANSILGALITKKLQDDKIAEIIVYSNAVFATNQPIMNIDYADKILNNEDVIINSVLYLTKRTEAITIRKDADSVTYTATAAQHNIITAIIFGTPLLIIIVGIIVWQVRKRKR